MGKTILYSPIGTTDPISNFRDGSMLHICRKYKPDVVYMLMSQEIFNHHKADNRYVYCLEKLGEFINHKFDIHIIEEQELVNVHDFDVVYKVISDNINQILKSIDPDDRLIVNIASGTPAMKYCLQILSALADYHFTPILVSSPQKKSNPHSEDQKNYNPEDMWECNEDNVENFEDRTSENCSSLMLKEIYDRNMKELVNKYDYAGAYALAKSVNFYTEDFANLLKAGQARLQLDYSKGQNILQQYGFQIPYTDNRKDIFEYTLTLGIKIKKGEYADFVRAITPLITDLLIKLIEHQCGIKIDDYTNCIGQNRRMWDENKLADTKILKVLNESYHNLFSYGDVKNVQLGYIANAYILKTDVNNAVKSLNDFERAFRNNAAHTITSLTDKKIKKQTGFTPEEIYKKLVDLVSQINIPTQQIDSYDKMNEFILSKM